MGVSGSGSAERAELAEVLSSELFRKSPNLARLLEYICTKYFEGSTGDLKEYHIGVEALGRSADFDPTTSSIVRVEIHRLRERLKKYYETEGLEHSVMITLQVGHYVPHFVPRTNGPGEAAAAKGAAADASGGNGPPPMAPTVGVAGPTPPKEPAAAGVAEPSPAPLVPSQAHVGSRLPRKWVLAVALLLAAAGGIAYWGLTRRGSADLPASALAPPVAAAAPMVEGEEIRILAGYFKDKYIDRRGKVWYGDRHFENGTVEVRTPRYIVRTFDPTIFHTLRKGDFSYRIPLRPGVYELRLYFAETFFGPDTYAGGGEASRVFNLEINGKVVVEEMDPYRDAGGNNIADVRVFKDVSPGPDGFLQLGFSKVRDEPFINAIEIVPGTPGRMQPIRIVAQQNNYTDQHGRLWEPDRYFSGGQLTVHKAPVAGADDAGLYAGERFGNFSYAIPVPVGRYTVTIRFAETYFGPENIGFGGAGSRIFDVYCNGVPLLRDFDIYKVAGGANRSITRVFRGLQPNALGKLYLSFVPSKNYALINAIEVVDESR